jgi:putative Mn2+ efflux pump MntP
MPTNQTLLSKGIKYLAWALPLLFIGPMVIYNAFINKQNDWHYLVLAMGIILCLAAMLLMFLGLNTIMKSLFND